MDKIYTIVGLQWIEDHYPYEDTLEVAFKDEDSAFGYIKNEVLKDKGYKIVSHEGTKYVAHYDSYYNHHVDYANYTDEDFLDEYWHTEGSIFYYIKELKVQ